MSDFDDDKNIIKVKSFNFAVRIIRLSQYLRHEHREYELGRQVVRSGTSIGANIEEALAAHSESDFYAKMVIARKEARETHYWIRLLRETQLLTVEEAGSLLDDLDEILKILNAITYTLKKKLSKK
ncbi:four helix bundle protein [bacterium]|nr:four helix bundle protein [bacterium]